MPKPENVNQARLWKPHGLADLTLFKARFTTYEYRPHTHDEYALGVIEQGVQRFHHKGATHDAPPSSIITVNPDEVHDGSSALTMGYEYRMIYVGLDYLHQAFAGLFPGQGLRAFPTPVTHDRDAAFMLYRALVAMEANPGAGEQLLLPALYALFQRHTTPRVRNAAKNSGAAIARVAEAIERIRERPEQDHGLDDLARDAGLSKFHFLRLFKRATGLTPHAFIVQRRVILARRSMEQGVSATDAAFLAGFADQSHLTRHFKAVYGVTPGLFKRLSE